MTKSVALLWLALCCAGTASAAPVLTNLRIQRMPLGSGQQSAGGTEKAEPVGDLGVYHVPQYMPGYPTSATIWPRAVTVPCVNDLCAGYEVTPELGRGEYLFFVPDRK